MGAGRLARGLILLARHPRPIVPSRICYGRTDVALAEPPERGAAALLAACAAWTEMDPVARIVSSPASRALLVARAAGKMTGAAVHVDDRLAELDFGVWENRPWSAIPRAEIDAWAADPVRYRPGGAESAADMLARVRRAWRTLSSSSDATLAVCHAGPIRCLRHIALREPLKTALGASIAFGAVTALPAGNGERP